MTKSKNILRRRHVWTDVEVETLSISYEDLPTWAIAHVLGIDMQLVYQKAQRMGLAKSAAYLDGPHACRLRHGDEVGKAFRYPKGHVPANKGLRRPGYAPGQMATTQFRKGERPHTWKPVGSERINADGYRDRKVTDTGYPPRDWVGVHRLLWIQHNGAIPAGHVVKFRDDDKTHITIENLECISLAANMRRNTVHNLPRELVEVIQLRGRVRRQINKREGKHSEKRNRGSSQPSVCNAGGAARHGETDGP